MINYEIPATLVEPLVPAGVELDRWRDTVYVSVVGFLFRNTRVLGVSLPGHVTFEEVNLRFYVRREAAGVLKRGVVFVRELVPRRAIALIARLWYNEPYRALPMSHRFAPNSRTGTDRQYAWRTRSGWTTLHAATAGPPRPLEAGSEEEFITEHYWGYTRQRDGGTIEYQVAHPRWNVWTAFDVRLDGNLSETYGPTFAAALAGPPRSAFVADGSPVIVYRPTRIR